MEYEDNVKLIRYMNDFCIKNKAFSGASDYFNKWSMLIESHQYEKQYDNMRKEENDQVFEFTLNNEVYKGRLLFNIGYIRRVRKNMSNPLVTLCIKDKMVHYNKQRCNYTYYEKTEQKYDDMDEIYVIPLNIFSGSDYLVIDGNHRLSLQINNGEKEVRAVYIKEVLAAASLMCSNDLIFYSLLCDITKLNNRNGGEVDLNGYENATYLFETRTQ